MKVEKCFGDLVALKMGDGYLDSQGRLVQNINKNTLWCITPYGFFAEDAELMNRPIGSTPFILQSLSWVTGCRRFLFENVDHSVQSMEMDLYTRNTPSARLVLSGLEVLRFTESGRFLNVPRTSTNPRPIEMVWVGSIDRKRNVAKSQVSQTFQQRECTRPLASIPERFYYGSR